MMTGHKENELQRRSDRHTKKQISYEEIGSDNDEIHGKSSSGADTVYEKALFPSSGENGLNPCSPLTEPSNDLSPPCPSLNSPQQSLEILMACIEDLRKDTKVIREELRSLQTQIPEPINEQLNDLKTSMSLEMSSRYADLENLVEKNSEELRRQLTASLERTVQLETKVTHLDTEVSELKQHVSTLADRVQYQDNELSKVKKFETQRARNLLEKEAESLSNNLIISGPVVPVVQQEEYTHNVVFNLVKENLNSIIPNGSIAMAKRIGKPPITGTDSRKIMVRFHSKDVKKNTIHASIQMRKDGLFINEELTQQVNGMFYDLRMLKKEDPKNVTKNIAVLYTRDGVICVKKTKLGKMYHILTEDDLKLFLHDTGLQLLPRKSS